MSKTTRSICVMALFVLVNIFADVSVSTAHDSRPIFKLESYALKHHAWICLYDNSSLDVWVSAGCEEFLTEDAVERYFKLRMRNFVKDLRFVKENSGTDQNFSSLHITLGKYNDHLEISTGMIEFSSVAALDYGDYDKSYSIVKLIAGSDEQITNRIKAAIDQMVETFAEDYYNMEDLIENGAEN
jgi:hypothetical protein